MKWDDLVVSMTFFGLVVALTLGNWTTGIDPLPEVEPMPNKPLEISSGEKPLANEDFIIIDRGATDYTSTFTIYEPPTQGWNVEFQTEDVVLVFWKDGEEDREVLALTWNGFIRMEGYLIPLLDIVDTLKALHPDSVLPVPEKSK